MKNYTKFSIVFIVLLTLLDINFASAQLRFGIKGGFDVNNNRLNKDILNSHNRLGFQVGGTMEFMAPIVGWGGELSVLYGHQKGDSGVSERKQSSTSYSISDYNYLRVPFNLKKRFSVVGLFGIFVQAGPYIEFKLSGGDVERIDSQWKSKSFGAGINAGAGVEVLKHLELGMYYRKSLTSNYSDKQGWENIVKKRPHNWSVDLTYFF